jgi:hypothetical protein
MAPTKVVFSLQAWFGDQDVATTTGGLLASGVGFSAQSKRPLLTQSCRWTQPQVRVKAFRVIGCFPDTIPTFVKVAAVAQLHDPY